MKISINNRCKRSLHVGGSAGGLLRINKEEEGRHFKPGNNLKPTGGDEGSQGARNSVCFIIFITILTPREFCIPKYTGSPGI